MPSQRMGRRDASVERSGERQPPRTLPQIMALHERILIIQALQSCGGSRTRAAAALGVPRTYLYRRVQVLQIDLGVIPARVGRPPRGGE
ncbi:MAG TPA: helix-turn-helix domain-containing protein [Conexivisphaerales archaeon]|nr:helix-turn-helix domain-containing protein [Conexivisphaerales archaeon]